MPSLALISFGCKLNQLEGEALAGAFVRKGFSAVPFGEKADIHIINTCTVTSRAEQKARRVIRKTVKENPSACVIVTGCYAEVEEASVRETVLSLPFSAGKENFFVIPGGKKSGLLDLPGFFRNGVSFGASVREWLASGKEPGRDPAFRFDSGEPVFHSRPSLKIQDGCDNACSYCRVRIARGKSVSLASARVLERLRLLEERGFAEAVLTGINVNNYRDGETDFPALLEYLLSGTKTIALRVSSTHIEGITESFLELVRHERIRPHFHLSVQSGSDAVLARMRRSYTAKDVLDAVRRLRAAKGDPFLACDIITGFPGESAGDFNATRELCREAEFTWIHAFPYSPRPGTEAWGFKNLVPERESTARVEKLIALGESRRKDYIARWKGRTVRAVVEKRPCREAGAFPGVTENYLKVLVRGEGEKPAAGSGINCVILDSFSGDGSRDAAALLAGPSGK